MRPKIGRRSRLPCPTYTRRSRMHWPRWKNSSARNFAASILSLIGWSSMGFRLGGKRLRPALVLLSAQACGPLRDEHLALAAASRSSTATLIHDDVLDEATIRRHSDTVNSRCGTTRPASSWAIICSRVLALPGRLDGNALRLPNHGAASRTMCEGELRQIASRGNFDLTEEEYLGIIADKTAALTACCCRLGAHYSDAEPPEVEAALVEYGLDLGIAFQIADDLLDVLGDEATVGKSLGSDLREAEIDAAVDSASCSRPIGPSGSEIMKALLSGGRQSSVRDALQPWLERFDAIAYAQGMARASTAAAPPRRLPSCRRARPARPWGVWPTLWSCGSIRSSGTTPHYGYGRG